MKNTITLLTAVLLNLAVKCQQHQAGIYGTITGFLAAEPFFSNQPGQLTVSFPYRVTDASGATSDSIFHSRVIHPFSALKFYFLHLGFDIGDRHQFAGFHYSPVAMSEGAGTNNNSITFTYGRNLFFDRPWTGRLHRKSLVLKPSLGVLYVNYKWVDNGSPAYLGSIDNKRKTIAFAGGTAGPSYTISSYRYSQTDSADLLNLYYGQQDWALQPKIAFGTNPYQHRCYVELYAAYTLPFSEKGRIYFMQDDKNQVAAKDLNDDALTVQYDGVRVKASPYHLNGWSVGFVVGINFSRTLPLTAANMRYP